MTNQTNDSMAKPTLTIIGGANGSGKTTVARELVAERKTVYLGADDIAREINPNDLSAAAIEAARIFSRRFDEYLESRTSLIVESTLAGMSLRKYNEKAWRMDYRISLLFIYLDSPELCIQRVAARVAKGGHDVPAEDIRRRFDRSNRNFWNFYKESADIWSLFSNADGNLVQTTFFDGETILILDDERYQKWLKMVKTQK